MKSILIILLAASVVFWFPASPPSHLAPSPATDAVAEAAPWLPVYGPIVPIAPRRHAASRSRMVFLRGNPDFAALARCESTSNPRAVSDTGRFRGLYQFNLGTWHGVGGEGDPINATVAEQTYRARLLYAKRGRQPWPYCGRYL